MSTLVLDRWAVEQYATFRCWRDVEVSEYVLHPGLPLLSSFARRVLLTNPKSAR
jgi:hypothetical protein